jgi:hypothetical protein
MDYAKSSSSLADFSTAPPSEASAHPSGRSADAPAQPLTREALKAFDEPAAGSNRTRRQTNVPSLRSGGNPSDDEEGPLLNRFPTALEPRIKRAAKQIEAESNARAAREAAERAWTLETMDHDEQHQRATDEVERRVLTGDAVQWARTGQLKCSYKGCSKVYNDVKKLKYHKKISHPYCRRCDLDFETAAEFLHHKLNSLRHIACPDCGVEFRDSNARDFHLHQVCDLAVVEMKD